MRKSLGMVLAGLAGLLTPMQVSADSEAPPPLFELGLAGGAGWFPDYPGAAQNHLNGLTLPYVRYRGEIIRSDEKGVRGRLIHGRDVELDISLSGSFPAESDDNAARRGMPDLDWMGEIGPRLQWTVARAVRWARIELEVPLRAVVSSDLKSLAYRGLVFNPELAYQHDDFLRSGVELKLGIGPIFATEELMDYFYAVEPRFAAAGRPAHEAEAGYLGSKVQLGLRRPIGERLLLFGYLRGDFLQGATNAGSPLLRDDTNIAVGAALAVSLYQSRRRATAD